MKISAFCLLVSVIALTLAGISRYSHFLSAHLISMLVLLAVAVSCLGALELKIHRRTRSAQQRTASTLAEALRNGALQ